MERWIGNKPTLGLQATYKKYSSLLGSSPISSSEKVLKIVEAECDKSFGREFDGVIVLTTQNFYFLSTKEVITIPYSTINDIKIKTDGKDKHEYALTLRVGRSNRKFDDIKKSDDADELLEILRAKIINPEQEVLSTVTHNFDTFLHAERLEELRKNNVKITAFLMKRDDMGLSKNGERLLKEMHPKALYVGEGFFKNKEKKNQGNFIVVDKTIWLYEYDNKKREARKILIWPLAFFKGALVDRYAIKTIVELPDKEILTLNSTGKLFIEALDKEGIEYKTVTRKWYRKIFGFRSGKAWKEAIALLGYSFILIFILAGLVGEDTETVSTSTETASETKTVEKEEVKEDTTDAKKQQESELKKQQEEEAKRLAEEEEKKKQAEAEAQRLAEEEKKKKEAEAEAARIAEQERLKQEAAAKAAEEEEKRKEAEAIAKAEAEKQQQANVYYKNCDAARAAGAAPIHRGEPGYAKHLDRDGDGIGCDR